ncbi:MAG: acyltransferase family protein [Alphaproteobacteria bacterium]
MTDSQLKYRPEIDGLRAISVVSILLYHAELNFFDKTLFTGGFVGVDVFFVISGYLISNIIFSELLQNKYFKFANFYERRARRILPMLFVVLLISCPIAFYTFLPNEFHEYIDSVISSIFFFSNFFFYSVTTEYGAESSLLKPLLHTWSLAIEEQFYLFFPIIVFLLFKFHQNLLKRVLILLFVISFFFSNIFCNLNPELNFFHPLSRFWELLTGSLLAYMNLKGKINKEFYSSNIFTLTGISLILFSVFFFNDSSPYPNYKTLIPVVGTALIIFFSSKNNYISKVLSSRVFVGVGLISYSVYLWHFPIFAFYRNLKPTINNFDKFESIILTIFLSVISYFVIEKKFRSKAIKLKYFLGFTVSVIIIFLSINFIVDKKDGFANRFPKLANDLLSIDKKLKRDLYVWNNKNLIKNKEFSNKKNKNIKLLIVGDSNSADLINSIFNLNEFSKIEISSLEINKGCGNLFLDTEKIIQKLKRPLAHKCIENPSLISKKNKEFLYNADVVVFASEWSLWELEYVIESHNKLIKNFGNKFLYFGNKSIDNPLTRVKDYKKIKKLFTKHPIYLDPTLETSLINKKLQSFFGEKFIDYTKIMCEPEGCPITNSFGEVLQYDSLHLTEKGAKELAKKLSKFKFYQKLEKVKSLVE